MSQHTRQLSNFFPTWVEVIFGDETTRRDDLELEVRSCALGTCSHVAGHVVRMSGVLNLVVVAASSIYRKIRESPFCWGCCASRIFQTGMQAFSRHWQGTMERILVQDC